MSEEVNSEETGRQLLSSNAKCPNCGGDLNFDPSTQKLFCPHCEGKFDFEKTKGQVKHCITNTNENYNEHEQWAKDMKAVKCQTCGATIMLSGLEMSKVCPYCGSDYVVEAEALSGLKPDVVIPFAFDAKECAVRFAQGIKRKFFAPHAFKKQLPENKIYGIYVPMFTFDADTSTKYNGVLEKRERHGSGKNAHTVYRKFHISGVQDMTHRDYVVETSSKMNQKQMLALLPYNMNDSYRFDTNFLRGFSVEHYEDSLRTCYSSARASMEECIKKQILSGYNYDSVCDLNMYHTYSNELYSYRLAPLYCLEFEYRGKKYMTQVNGQTGKIGKGYPISMLKKVILGVLIAIVVIAAFAGIFYLGYQASK